MLPSSGLCTGEEDVLGLVRPHKKEKKNEFLNKGLKQHMQQGSGNIQIEIFAGSTGFVISLRTL